MIVPLVVGTVVGAGATTLIAQRELGGAIDGMVARLNLPIPAGKDGNALEIIERFDPVGADALKKAWITAVVAGSLAAVITYALLSKRS